MVSELIANQIVPPGGMRFDSAALCQYIAGISRTNGQHNF